MCIMKSEKYNKLYLPTPDPFVKYQYVWWGGEGGGGGGKKFLQTVVTVNKDHQFCRMKGGLIRKVVLQCRWFYKVGLL